MWSKLTERNDRTLTKMISNQQEIYRILATPGIEVATLLFASDDIVFASWRYNAEEKVHNLRHTNEDIGAYVTAGAKIHLYSYLGRLQKRALYCDNDSLIYIQPTAGIPLIKTCDSLGPMTPELKPGFRIEEFESGGLKNYAYRIADPVTGNRGTVCKVLGITLNYSKSQMENFDVSKSLVLRGDDPEKVTLHTERKIKYKRADGKISIVTEPEDNVYRVSFLK